MNHWLFLELLGSFGKVLQLYVPVGMCRGLIGMRHAAPDWNLEAHSLECTVPVAYVVGSRWLSGSECLSVCLSVCRSFSSITGTSKAWQPATCLLARTLTKWRAEGLHARYLWRFRRSYMKNAREEVSCCMHAACGHEQSRSSISIHTVRYLSMKTETIPQ